MSAITELAMGAAVGGGLQMVSEAFKLGGGLVSSLRDAAISNNEQARANAKLLIESRNAAAARSSSFLRATLGITAFVAAFLLPFVAGWVDMPTSLITEGSGFSLFWGFIKIGGKMVVTEAQGFVMGPEFWSTVRLIGGAAFGIGAVGTGRRIF